MTIERDQKVTITPPRFPKGEEDDYKFCGVIEVTGGNYPMLELVFGRNLMSNKDMKKLSGSLKENSPHVYSHLRHYKKELETDLIEHTYSEITNHCFKFLKASKNRSF